VYLALHDASVEQILTSLTDLVKDGFEEKDPIMDTIKVSIDKEVTVPASSETITLFRPDNEPVRHTENYSQAMSTMVQGLSETTMHSGYKLGNDVIAQQSVPSAVFSALRGQIESEGWKGSKEVDAEEKQLHKAKETRKTEFLRVLQVRDCYPIFFDLRGFF
jgi:hypothetical protein